ncbi:uncharacterized protein RAG0_05811 [Rhynchosporium agropyri]|uniref:Uncharacterized protein n=2 Tax=Rhynchosporium TaxID=38037 RepID=A0A1E1MLX8_RHYSE|nr:uncharacterized protein RAG0_05811 [Rhynchosporium agropyri]CZT50091.1 uncharacterized protein RSE6_11018 [Rhynchosporium secalis]
MVPRLWKFCLNRKRMCWIRVGRFASITDPKIRLCTED